MFRFRMPTTISAFLSATIMGFVGCGFNIPDGTGNGQPPHDESGQSWVLRWNRIANDASGLDHTPLEPGENRTFGHHLGPGRSSRAMAIVHIAMFEVVNAISPRYESYTKAPIAPPNTSMKSAIAQAAHDTLVALFSSQAENFARELEEDLSRIPDGRAKENGIALGRESARVILEEREQDGSGAEDIYEYGSDPGDWRVDPLNPDDEPLGEEWYHVRPFTLGSAVQFRAPPPPSIDSEEYAIAYNEVFQIGGDGLVTPTTRTEVQTLIGMYWAYDGTPSLCAPPRLYNQIAVIIGVDQGLDVVEMARLLALVNVALADAGIAIWESKYYYNYWRPVTGIRESDLETGPSGLGDDNPLTTGDPTWTPLGAPASNLAGPNFTPPFPAYPSGHAGFGGALFQVLRRYFGTDDIPFSFVSDELNGVTVDNEGNVRPLIERSFSSLSQAEEENGQSRIYLGIHWEFDKTEGISQGRQVGDEVFDTTFRPLP